MNIYQIITEMYNFFANSVKGVSKETLSFEEKREGIVDSIDSRET